MAAIQTVEIDAHVSAGIIRPGDKLVIAVARPLDMAEREKLREAVEWSLPGVEAVVIQAEALVVYRS
jgi:hypothetical protein